MADKRYPIRPGPPEFYCGTSADGRQVMMGIRSSKEMVALFFDQDGSLVSTGLRKLPEEPWVSGLNPYDSEFVAKVDASIGQWQQEMHFRPGMIKVKHFEWEGMSIVDLPEHFAEFLADPVSFAPDEEEREKWMEEVRQWRREDRFVLWWVKEFWMDADGNIEST